MIIAEGGLVVSYVDIWNADTGLYRIFEDTKTGIDIFEWLDIRDEEHPLDETWTFRVPSNK